jgi:hypothetical protein
MSRLETPPAPAGPAQPLLLRLRAQRAPRALTSHAGLPRVALKSPTISTPGGAPPPPPPPPLLRAAAAARAVETCSTSWLA